MAIQNRPVIRFARSPSRVGYELVNAFIPPEQEPNAQQVTRQQVEGLQEIFEQVHDQIEEFEQRRQQMIQELQMVAVELAVSVAAKLTHRDEESSRESAQAMTRQLVENLDQPVECEVWFHPDDLAAVQELVQEDPKFNTGSLRLQADPSLQIGDCRIRTGANEFVSSVQTKLIELRQNLLENLQHAEDERRQNESLHQGIKRFPDRRATG